MTFCYQYGGKYGLSLAPTENMGLDPGLYKERPRKLPAFKREMNGRSFWWHDVAGRDVDNGHGTVYTGFQARDTPTRHNHLIATHRL